MNVNLQAGIPLRAALLMELRDLLAEPGPDLGASSTPVGTPADRAVASVPAPLPPEVKARLARLEGELARSREEIDALRREPQAVADPAAITLAGKAFDKSEAISALLDSAVAASSADYERLRLRTERIGKRLNWMLAVIVFLGLSGIVLVAISLGWLHAEAWHMPGLDGPRHAISAMLTAILPKP